MYVLLHSPTHLAVVAVLMPTLSVSQMGFTTTTNPDLLPKVAVRVSRMKGDFSRAAEDAVVAELVEEVLAQTSAAGPSSTGTQPAASRSESELRRSKSSIPGSWL